MEITIDVSEENEGTDSPWWAIVDPKQNMKVDDQSVYHVASMITGPFFSRESAQNHLTRCRYNYGKNPHVFCFSGYNSHEYKTAYKEAERKLK
jgi:hypothetical protein